MNILFDKYKGWLIRGPTGFEPCSELQAWIRCVVDEIYDPHELMRMLKRVAYQQCREVYYIDDARRFKFFICGEDGIGSRYNHQIARFSLMSDGATRQIAEAMLRVAKLCSRISLADLTRISRAA